ncbi:MAG: prephenate dehydratase [Chloroflexota bacterium]
MSLDKLRENIDKIDAEIVRPIAERLRVAEAIGKEKESKGLAITDMAREKVVLERVRALAREKGVSEEGIGELWQEIIRLTKSAEGVSVAYQGEPGAYSEEAAFRFFGAGIRPRPCESLDDVFRVVETGEAQSGVIPIENSLEGSISRSYDLLLDSSLKVAGEIELRISHCLIASPESSLDKIRRVYSHPQALGQCRSYLRHLGAELVATYDTAGSVKMIKEMGTLDGAAIASARAAQLYGMKILAREIEDNPFNFTRFFVLSRIDAAPTGTDRTSVVFAVKHRPGALYDTLYELARRNINLTKIESRPTRKKAWEYNFYLDFEGHREDGICREALEALEERALFIKVLGSYPRAR